jgi:hypothetical protein
MRSGVVLGAVGILLTSGAAAVEAQQPAFRVTDLNTSHPSPRYFDPSVDSKAVGPGNYGSQVRTGLLVSQRDSRCS